MATKGSRNSSRGAPRSPESARSVLVIEDDPGLRSLLGMVLLRDGWIVSVAANGEAAIASLELALPDVVLLDLNMPVLDGWDVLARRASEPTWSRIPVIVMSAEHHHAEAVLEFGATAFLAKPFSVDDLRQVLQQFLG